MNALYFSALKRVLTAVCIKQRVGQGNFSIFFSAQGLVDALTAHLGPAIVHSDYTAAGLRPGVRGHGVFPSFRVRECLGPYRHQATYRLPIRRAIRHELAGLANRHDTRGNRTPGILNNLLGQMMG